MVTCIRLLMRHGLINDIDRYSTGLTVYWVTLIFFPINILTGIIRYAQTSLPHVDIFTLMNKYHLKYCNDNQCKQHTNIPNSIIHVPVIQTAHKIWSYLQLTNRKCKSLCFKAVLKTATQFYATSILINIKTSSMSNIVGKSAVLQMEKFLPNKVCSEHIKIPQNCFCFTCKYLFLIPMYQTRYVHITAVQQYMTSVVRIFE